ncbi:phosphate ABC transporter periplasmic phosphate-binding protein PstS [Desulfocucumis palustris]|uniref:Phosphate-binding protein n=1 Tax=Desulfocucumis palustris TaxID=1898651 RepID=A0A2L2XB72_9FIRM|nr:phosphate ABC transporter substrate-binding protein [Desulfocucumis palustris]GBF33234.1 phosphate ABC transporter periplasmic phosphate-binding protein PstS [Desulfocucumis palustris]
MLKKSKWIILAAAMLIMALAAAGCGGGGAQDGEAQKEEPKTEEVSGNLTSVGSTALQPLVEKAAADFMAKNPQAQIVVQGGGSGNGLTQVSQGAADIGNSDVFAEEKDGIDAAQLVDHKVCVVGMAAVVNDKVGVDNLTKQQLIDIFTGKVANWKEVGGVDQKIVLVNRPKGSGTRATFKKYAIDNAEEAQGIEEDSSGTVRKIIGETPGAIGYLALSYLDGSVKPVKIDDVEPVKESILSGQYPVWAYEHMYTKGEPDGLKKAFLDYILSEDVQKTLIPELGYIPVTEMKVSRDAQGNITQQ